MIELKRWQCQSQSCRSSALGMGSPVGLRAIGWKVEMMGNGVFPREISCPLHFQEEAITTPHQRLEASDVYARFQQLQLARPDERLHGTTRRTAAPGP